MELLGGLHRPLGKRRRKMPQQIAMLYEGCEGEKTWHFRVQFGFGRTDVPGLCDTSPRLMSDKLMIPCFPQTTGSACLIQPEDCWPSLLQCPTVHAQLNRAQWPLRSLSTLRCSVIIWLPTTAPEPFLRTTAQAGQSLSGCRQGLCLPWTDHCV